MPRQMHTSRLLKNIEQDLETLVKVLPAFLLVLSGDGIVLTANDSVAQLLKSNVDEMIGKSIYSMWRLNAETFKQRMTQVLQLQIPDSFEVSDGRRTVLIYLYPVVSTDGELTVIAFGQDVSDRIRSEEQVRELTNQLEQKVRERTSDLESANHQLREEKRRAEMLSRFSRLLMEDTRDYGALMQSIAYDVTQMLGDLCLIAEFDRVRESFQALAIAHRDEVMLRKYQNTLLNQIYPYSQLKISRDVLDGKVISLRDLTQVQARELISPDFGHLVGKGGYKDVRFLPLLAGDQVVGLMMVARFSSNVLYSPADIAFLNSLTIPLALTLQNVRLFEQVNKHREQLRGLSQQLVQVQESQFRHLAKELHDQVGQDLTAININLNLMRGMLGADAPEMVSNRLDDTIKLVESTVERMRDIMAEFRPPVLDAYGLTAALYWYSEQFSRRTGVAVEVHDRELHDLRMPTDVEIGLFRIAQEALNNVAKHASASHVDIYLKEVNGMIEMSIQDNGQGFDIKKRISGSLGHWGLTIMRERAEAIGGTLALDAQPGNGVCVRVSLSKVVAQ